jgi:flagellar basal-body rod modification protein FlgD
MSSVSSITGATTNTADTSSTSSTDNSTLDYKDFLNLLSVQMQNQDPFNPTSDTDFIAQMANFSTLQEVSDFSDNFTTYSSRQQQISSQEYLGKYATVEPTGSSAVTGQVTAVSLGSDGTIYVTMNGTKYSASDVTSVSNSSSSK